MPGRHFLQRKHGRPAKNGGPPTATGLLELVQEQVVNRFVQMSGSNVQAVALAVSEPDEEEPVPNPSHPACEEFASTDYCRESWQLHLAQLKHKPETHWGTCQHGRTCAIIPIACEHRCLAVVKLAGPASLDKKEFRRLVEVIELLARDFAVSHVDFLRRVPGGVSADGASGPHPGANDATALAPSPTHPQVIRAMEYITAHLSDPRLTVAKVASTLGIYPTYLSELFVEQVGQRMSRFIANRRVETAKKLLVTTEWQVKRIALETGHANPNWFCHVFGTHTGLTPGEYRAAARAAD